MARLCCAFGILLVLFGGPALALDQAESDIRAEAASFLYHSVVNALRAGETPKVWVNVFGKLQEVPVAKVDEEMLTLSVQNNPFPLKWRTISREDLLSVAKGVANGRGERLLVAAEVALALGFFEETNKLLAQAGEADRTLGPKIRAIAQELNKAAPETAPPPPAPKAAVIAAPAKNAAPLAKAVVAPPPNITGPVVHVGPSRQCKTIGEGLKAAKPGVTILIDPGVYQEAHQIRCSGTLAAPVRIMGLLGPDGQRPLIDGEGVRVSGFRSVPRALFQIMGEHVVVENLEFKNARNGNNGAGIRFVGCKYPVVRNCKITYCDMGMQGGCDDTVLIEGCEVSHNGTKDYDGYSHNFYMGGNRVVVRNSYIHDSLFGQNFKSRAHYNELWYNYICDSMEGEVCLVDHEGDTDKPNSHSLMAGNVVVSFKRPDHRNNTKFIDWGSDTGKPHDGTLFAFHNTFVAGTERIAFVGLSHEKTKAVLINNIFAGSNKIARGKSSDVKGFANVVAPGAEVPPGVQLSIKAADPGFANAAQRDFRLGSASPCLGRGAPADKLVFTDGDGKPFTAKAESQYVHPLKTESRPAVQAPSPGAYGP